MKIDRLLTLDAATCFLMGLLLVSATHALATLLNLPDVLLLWTGVILFPIALFMFVLSRQATPSTLGTWLVILGNAAWVVASLAALIVTHANALGVAFVLAQAAVVAALAWLESTALSHHRTLTA